MKKVLKTIILFYCLLVSFQSLWAQDEALKILPNGNVGIGVSEPKEKLQVEGNIKATGKIEDKWGSLMPVGSIMAFAGNKAPDGWLLCDGSAYPKEGDKNELFKIIDYFYGQENGQFRVPDLRQTFVMGANENSASDKVGAKGEPEQHNHEIKVPTKTFPVQSRFPRSTIGKSDKLSESVSTGIVVNDQKNKEIKSQIIDFSATVDISFDSFKSGNSSGQNRPKWMALNYIIKY